MTHRFDCHFQLERAADGVMWRIDARERDQLLQRRRPCRRRRASHLAFVLVDRNRDPGRSRRRRGRQTDSFVEALHFSPVRLESDDLAAVAASLFGGERAASDEWALLEIDEPAETELKRRILLRL